MTMKWIRAAVMACGLVLLAGPAAAQEMTFRSGVITGITPMQVEAAAAPQTASRSAGAFGRALGRVAGRAAARVTGEYTYEAYEVASSATNDLVSAAAAAPAAGARTVTAYMVMLRFDEGGESAIRAASVDNLRVGARARVFGSGANAQIVAE